MHVACIEKTSYMYACTYFVHGNFAVECLYSQELLEVSSISGAFVPPPTTCIGLGRLC